MSILVRPILTDLFTCFTRGLIHVLYAALPRNAISMHGPVAGLLFPRLGRLRSRFAALLDRFHAGTLPPPRLPARSRSGSASAKAGRRRVRKPRPRPAKPADASKLGRKAFGDFIAPECRDGPSGTRPPNRIGYARGVRLPRDYKPAAKNE